MPIDGKLVLRPPKDNDDKQPANTTERRTEKRRER
jgi:hypothetical protein